MIVIIIITQHLDIIMLCCHECSDSVMICSCTEHNIMAVVITVVFLMIVVIIIIITPPLQITTPRLMLGGIALTSLLLKQISQLLAYCGGNAVHLVLLWGHDCLKTNHVKLLWQFLDLQLVMFLLYYYLLVKAFAFNSASLS